MKILGEGEGGNYICEISHTEFEKVFNKYYGDLRKLSVGDEFNLGNGYDFRRDIQDVCKQMTDTIDSFRQVQDSLFAFAKVVGNITESASKGGMP